MKHLLIGLTLCSMAMTALAGEKVDETLDADGIDYVKIEHVNGKAKIRGWDRNQVKVVGELSDRTEEFIFKRRGNDIIIEVDIGHHVSGWNKWDREEGDDLEIFMPKSNQVSYTAMNATVDIADVTGGADIETINGDINAKDLGGRIRIESVNGDIDAKRLVGNVSIATVNGDITDVSKTASEATYTSVNGDMEIHSLSKEFSAETVNGDMDLELADIEELSLSTVNGNVKASLNLLKNGDIRANSVGGSIELMFQKDVSARFDIQGHAGGRITNKLTDDEVQRAKYGPSRWLEFSVNGGSARVNISTVSGKIKLDTK